MRPAAKLAVKSLWNLNNVYYLSGIEQNPSKGIRRMENSSEKKEQRTRYKSRLSEVERHERWVGDSAEWRKKIDDLVKLQT